MHRSLDIDRIVREVVKRLLDDAAPSSETEPPPQPSAALLIAERVVTLRQVEGRLGQVVEVVVPERAVVTPSVHDTLRQHRIPLRRCSQLKPNIEGKLLSPATRSHATWVVADSELTAAMENAAALSPPELQLRGDLSASISALATGLSDGDNAVIVSERAMLAATLANRYPSLRAAWIRGTEDLSSAYEQIGANVLVVDRRLPPLFRKCISFARRSSANMPPPTLSATAAKENHS